ncbi:hypothetical protein I316_01905 [Kwoniella heveanensis BCC8398]|uniref:Zn(2)-C6 fungal-type domain-containing protein n=1 Tax=Kwoniella heveanensis BCC8398 TaxID=1296120 RepID=A0A1B9H056_9TREE|nr:hypothetical protein I316_01905 [Kwoniella heveanensis BCC8398]
MASAQPSSSTSSRRASGEGAAAAVAASTPSSSREATAAQPTPSSSSSRKVNSNGSSTPQSQKQKELAEAEAKRRKIQRACDACRRKKIKCDGPMNSLSTNKCAHCQEYGLDCTYVEAAKRRGPPKGYIENLEQRCGRLERMLHQLHPSIDLNEYVGPPLDREEFDLPSYQETLRNLHIPQYPAIKALPTTVKRSASVSSSAPSPAAGAPSPSSQILGHSPWRPYQKDPKQAVDPEEMCEDADMHMSIAKGMQKLNIREAQWRYHGKASGAHLMRTFQDLKYHNQPVKDGKDFLDDVNKSKRTQFWQIPEWELVIANEGIRPLDPAIWPTAGLDIELINAYFEHQNLHLPLLNKILFRRQYDAGLWRTNGWFAKVCLMIFANGSRYVDDDEVYWPVDLALSEEGKERLRTDKDGTRRYSAGWKYLLEVLRMGRSLMQGPNLYEFQCQVLLCLFLQGSAVPHVMWLLSGVGLRLAQEIGIHIRSTLFHVDPIERALYNRAFWCLYHIDRVNCAGIGRSVALQDADFDADYPIDVDDEYWDTGDPDLDFKQPEGAGVSSIAAFVQTLKLDHILGATLRTIYAVNQQPEQKADVTAQRAIVVELDSALNSWADQVPDELRWDPTRTDYHLFQQSAVLYVHYYYCQILIHRPFIPTPKSPTSAGASLPSLAICANASRSICNIIDVSLRRGRAAGLLPGRCLHPSFMLPSWMATILLLINIYSGKQSTAERDRAMIDIRKCITVSKEMEVIWRMAGKMTDMIVELASEHDMPVATPPSHGEKRSYDGESVGGSPAGATAVVATPSPVDPTARALAIGRHFDAERLVNATSSTAPLGVAATDRNNTNQQNYGTYLQPTPASLLSVTPQYQSQVNNSAPMTVSPSSNKPDYLYRVPSNSGLPDVSGTSSPAVNQNYLGTFPAQSTSDAFFDPNSLGNQLFDLGTSAFNVPGTGEETDMWAQLFSDFT